MSGFPRLGSLLIILLIFFAPSSPAFAKATVFLNPDELQALSFRGYENVNPNSLIYPIKRLQEELALRLTFKRDDQDKYRYNLLEKRFGELVYIANYDKTSFLFETTDRYNSFVGQLNKDLLAKDHNQKTKILSMIKTLERLRDRYHSGSPNWVKIQETIDSTKRLV